MMRWPEWSWPETRPPPRHPESIIEQTRDTVRRQWNAWPLSRKTAAAIIAVNASICAAWQVPYFAGKLTNALVHVPAAGRSHTLLGAVFAHASPLHCGVNMMALWALAPGCTAVLGNTPLFLAFYTSSGMASSLVSHLAALLRNNSRAMYTGSLGASGALFACLGAVAAARPDALVSIMFIPALVFPLKVAFPTLMAIDLLGILRGWQFFDHYVGSDRFCSLMAATFD